MSKSRGEGRSKGEKSQIVITPVETLRDINKKQKQEEAEWASRSGPVYIKRPARDKANELDNTT